MVKHLYIIFLSIGLIFLFVTSLIAYFRFDFLKHAVKTEGVMTDFVLSTGRSRAYMPVVEFTSLNGQKQSFTSWIGSNPNPHKVGDHVNVFYNPTNPSNAIVDSFFSLWLLPFIFGIIGTIFTIVGILVWKFVS